MIDEVRKINPLLNAKFPEEIMTSSTKLKQFIVIVEFNYAVHMTASHKDAQP